MTGIKSELRQRFKKASNMRENLDDMRRLGTVDPMLVTVVVDEYRDIERLCVTMSVIPEESISHPATLLDGGHPIMHSLAKPETPPFVKLFA